MTVLLKDVLIITLSAFFGAYSAEWYILGFEMIEKNFGTYKYSRLSNSRRHDVVGIIFRYF